MISADMQTEEAGLYLQAERNRSQHPRQEFPPPPERPEGGVIEAEADKYKRGFHSGVFQANSAVKPY